MGNQHESYYLELVVSSSVLVILYAVQLNNADNNHDRSIIMSALFVSCLERIDVFKMTMQFISRFIPASNNDTSTLSFLSSFRKWFGATSKQRRKISDDTMHQ